MSALGKIQSLWRYPVKSMRGEELDEAFAGFSGVYGDRLFAFKSAASPPGFPWLTAREKNQMLLYRPRFRQPEKALRPVNQTAAESLGSGLTPIYANPDDLMVDVQTPGGDTLAIDDPRLIANLRDGIDAKHQLTLLRSERAMTDCRPISVFSMQSAAQLSEEVSMPLDHRRFRANIYVDVESGQAFQEDKWVGRSIRIGSKVIVSILQRDARCAIITIDPDTANREPAVLKTVTQRHDGMAGVYGAVLVEGTVRKGDPIELLGNSGFL
jgi:MOSC domain-containing protein